MRTYLLAGLALVVASGSALAGTPYIDKREQRQAERIYNGIKNGQLTFQEAGRLIKGQQRVRQLEKKFKSDGVVTPLERAILHNRLNVQSVRIYNKKHN
jgi:hypothetical protein